MSDVNLNTQPDPATAPAGWVFETREEIIDACSDAKEATVRQALKEFNGAYIRCNFSFPNPYLLAMTDATGRIDDQERCHFRRVPAKRNVLALLEQYPQADYIAAYFDLHIGTMEDRLAGEMDEPSDYSAEVILYRRKAVQP